MIQYSNSYSLLGPVMAKININFSFELNYTHWQKVERVCGANWYGEAGGGGGENFRISHMSWLLGINLGQIAIRVKRPGHQMEQLWETLPVIFIKNMGEFIGIFSYIVCRSVLNVE